MLYPQNGDRIVAVDFVTSFHPLYSAYNQQFRWHHVARSEVRSKLQRHDVHLTMICADFEYAPRIRSHDIWRYINLRIIMYVIIKLWKVRSAKSAGALNAANAMNGHTVLRSLLTISTTRPLFMLNFLHICRPPTPRTATWDIEFWRVVSRAAVIREAVTRTN